MDTPRTPASLFVPLSVATLIGAIGFQVEVARKQYVVAVLWVVAAFLLFPAAAWLLLLLTCIPPQSTEAKFISLIPQAVAAPALFRVAKNVSNNFPRSLNVLDVDYCWYIAKPLTIQICWKNFQLGAPNEALRTIDFSFNSCSSPLTPQLLRKSHIPHQIYFSLNVRLAFSICYSGIRTNKGRLCYPAEGGLLLSSWLRSFVAQVHLGSLFSIF